MIGAMRVKNFSRPLKSPFVDYITRAIRFLQESYVWFFAFAATRKWISFCSNPESPEHLVK